jgi:hypothetical protein
MVIFQSVNPSNRPRSIALLFLVLSFLSAGCAARRPVTIPEEWRTTVAKPPVTVPTRPERSSVGEPRPSQPVLQPLPNIHEEDLNAVPEGDSGLRPRPDVAPSPPDRVKPVGPAVENPQHLASMHLVNTAKTALQQGNADQAIAQLEQAIQVDAYNAEAFLVLAEAWKSKGDGKRALEFARKAEILYQDNPKALKKVYLLEADLLKASGQAREAEKYRQKASRLEM